MRKIILLIFISVMFSSCTYGQLGSRYFHCDTLNVTPSARDTTWTDPWEQALIYADSVDLYLKIGAPDVAQWSSRYWIYWPSGMALSIGPSPKLKRLQFRTVTGSGVVYILGYKKERQW